MLCPLTVSHFALPMLSGRADSHHAGTDAKAGRVSGDEASDSHLSHYQTQGRRYHYPGGRLTHCQTQGRRYHYFGARLTHCQTQDMCYNYSVIRLALC